MDLTKKILVGSESPLSFSKFVFCFNFSYENEVWNLPAKKIGLFTKHHKAIGVWKIKQLKQ